MSEYVKQRYDRHDRDETEFEKVHIYARQGERSKTKSTYTTIETICDR